MTDLPAWRVEMYWRSSIVGHLTGWLPASDTKGERTFRAEESARKYAAKMTGIPAFLVPHMSRKGVVVPTTRRQDWRDWLAALGRTRTDDAVGTPEGVNQTTSSGE